MFTRVSQIENSLQQGLFQTPRVGCQSWQKVRVLLIACRTKYLSLNVCFYVRFLFNQRSNKHYRTCCVLKPRYHIWGRKKKLGIEVVAYVASVSLRFRSKERGTRVKADCAKNGASKRVFGCRFISFAAKTGLSLLRNQTETLATQAIEVVEQ